MSEQWLTALGGLGLFLLGMTVMTDGLRGLAGNTLQRWLARFTNSPGSGALTGIVSTAVLQSSSATTVTTVGLVAAGLLTFPQALGIIFGANVGTTVTGWMVALLGFKLKIGTAALPVIFLGMMLRLFGRKRWGKSGLLLAGFGLVFLGISFMQLGMAGMESIVSPEDFPPDTWAGRIALVAIGAALTLVTQSSSAGVAIAMTALASGSLSFPQAACLVIGMDVGTTVTAVLASLGSSVAARRTGLSHTIFNLFTAVGALLVLDLYVIQVQALWPGSIETSPSLVLVGFHTLFNIQALLVGLPLAAPFARFMERLVPDTDRRLSRRLDARLLEEPSVAEAALLATLQDEFAALLDWLNASLSNRPSPGHVTREDLLQDLRETQRFLDELNQRGLENGDEHGVMNAFHALEHLHRIHARLCQHDRVVTLRESHELMPDRDALLDVGRRLRSHTDSGIEPADREYAERLYRRLLENAARNRERFIAHAVERDVSVERTNAQLAAQRWMERMAHHLWRTSAHLTGQLVLNDPPE